MSFHLPLGNFFSLTYMYGRFYACMDLQMDLNSMFFPFLYFHFLVTAENICFLIFFYSQVSIYFKNFLLITFQVCCNHEFNILCTAFYGIHLIFGYTQQYLLNECKDPRIYCKCVYLLYFPKWEFLDYPNFQFCFLVASLNCLLLL